MPLDVGPVGVCALPATTSVPWLGPQPARIGAGHRLVPFGPGECRPHDLVKQDEAERSCLCAVPQHGQVAGGDPAVAAPQGGMIFERCALPVSVDQRAELGRPFER
jgi:hypothetical protein